MIWASCLVFRKKFRLWIGAEALQIKKGVFGTHEIIVKWNKIQSVHLKQSLYQQKHDLATIVLQTAGGTITILFLDLIIARKIQNYALYKIESSVEEWM